MSKTDIRLYSRLYNDVPRRLGISWDEYVLLYTVYYLSEKEGYCYKSSRSLGEDLGFNKRKTQHLIQGLVKFGLLERLDKQAVRCSQTFVEIHEHAEGIPEIGTPIPESGTPYTKNRYTVYPNLVRKTDARVTKNNNKEKQKSNKRSPRRPRYSKRVDEDFSEIFKTIDDELAAKEAAARLRKPTSGKGGVTSVGDILSNFPF